MTSTSENNPRLWNLLLILTVILGATAAFLVSRKEDFFPTLYSSSHSQHEPQAEKDAQKAENTKASERETPEIQAAAIAKPESEIQKTGANVSGKYKLVAGSFLSSGNANQLITKIKSAYAGFNPRVVQVKIDTTFYYRVIVARSDNVIDLDEVKDQMKTAGYDEGWIIEGKK
jgi:cell division protein FtsN